MQGTVEMKELLFLGYQFEHTNIHHVAKVISKFHCSVVYLVLV